MREENKTEREYKKWLVAIVNTRFLENTSDELKRVLNYNSLKSNGVKRLFADENRARVTFYDLSATVRRVHDIELEDLMRCYEGCTDFYVKNFERKKNKEDIAEELFRFLYFPEFMYDLKKSRRDIYEGLGKDDMSAAFLVLFLIGALPRYNSKEGDVADIDSDFNKTTQFFIRLFGENPDWNFHVVRHRYLEEEQIKKTRITLVKYVLDVINLYRCSYDFVSQQESTKYIRSKLFLEDLSGFWYDSSKPSVNFWQLEALQKGAYYATYWKKVGNKMKGIKYTLFVLNEEKSSDLSFIFMHPKYLYNRINGLNAQDYIGWFKLKTEDIFIPSEFKLERRIPSENFPVKYEWFKCDNVDDENAFNHWLQNFEIEKENEECEYTFIISLYAMTLDFLYVRYGESGEFLRVPRYSDALDLRGVELDDMVGIVEMNGKEYLAFDDLNVYIEITPENFSEFCIDIVDRID